GSRGPSARRRSRCRRCGPARAVARDRPEGPGFGRARHRRVAGRTSPGSAGEGCGRPPRWRQRWERRRRCEQRQRRSRHRGRRAGERPLARVSSWRRSLLLPELLAQALALLGGKLLPALAELLPLLGRHLLPARKVMVDTFALFGLHRRVPAEALLDPPLSLGRQPLKTLVGAL